MFSTAYPALLLTQLHRTDLPAMRSHLLRLDEADRTQRFAQRVSDEVIEGYLSRLSFERDAHYGMVLPTADRTQLVALAHLAFDTQGKQAEVGVSVDADWRRQGLATRLLHRAMLHARNSGVPEVVMYFLPYNTELTELARSLGMKLSVGEGQGIARLRVAAPGVASLTEEMLADWSQLTGKSLATWAEGTEETSTLLHRAVDDASRGAA
jgi:RimJ/RimL family protein N-acetyltransferase